MTESDPIKQVIVIRRDLKMRRGKEIAQGAHAAMLWLVKRIIGTEADRAFGSLPGEDCLPLGDAEIKWLLGDYTKVVCQIETEWDLLELYNKARDAGLESQAVVDIGATEFHGVANITALAIGPDYSSKIDPITKDLKLY